MGQGYHVSIDIAKRNFHPESVDTMTVCYASFVSSMSLFLSVVSAEEHAAVHWVKVGHSFTLNSSAFINKSGSVFGD